jgi:predicted transcriptional regulator
MMVEEHEGGAERLTIYLSESMVKRLKSLATRTNRSLAEAAVDVLDRNLPRADDQRKRVPYT